MNLKTSLLEPTWSTLSARQSRDVAGRFFAWLADQGSLTQQVIGACNGRFKVRVLHQGWGRPLQSESQLLGMSRAETALIREVELRCDEVPWVFARTLIPATSLSGRARRLAYLGNKPLGALLFSEPRTERGLTQVARLLPRHPLYAAAVDHLDEKPHDLWGRRTLYRYFSKPILVNEIFLPDIPTL